MKHIKTINLQLQYFHGLDARTANLVPGKFTTLVELEYSSFGSWSNRVQMVVVDGTIFVVLENYWHQDSFVEFVPTRESMFIRALAWPKLVEQMSKIIDTLTAADVYKFCMH